MAEEPHLSKEQEKGIGIDRVSGVLLLLLGLYVMWERRVLPLGSAQNPGPGYFPLLLALLLVIFGAVLIVQGKQSRPLRSIPRKELSHAVSILGCLIFVALFLEKIGYRITIFLVLGFLFGIIERLNVWITLILTIFLSLGSFWLFDTLLKVPLPRGWGGF